MDKHCGSTEHDSDELPADLLPLARLYASQPVPRPTPQETNLLFERLLLEQTDTTRTHLSGHVSHMQILRVARWQIKLLGPWFWVIGVSLLVAGFVLAPTVLGVEGAVNVLITLLPLTALLSIIHAVQALSLRVHEVEASCATNIVETVSGLVLAIVFFNVLLGLIATSALALAHWAAFGPLFTTWLGPLLLLVGISLPVALRWGTLPAVLIGGVPWLLLVGLAFMQQSVATGHASLMPQNGTSLLLSGLSALLGLSLLLLFFLRGANWQRYLLQYQ